MNVRVNLSAYGVGFVAALLTCLAVSSGFLALLPGGAAIRSTLLVLILGLSVVGIVAAIAHGEWMPAAISSVLLCSIWVFLFIYSARFGQEFSITSGGVYFAGTLAALFVLAVRRINIDRALNLIFLALVAYVVLYLLANSAFEQGLIRNQPGVRLIIGADDFTGRKARLALAGALVALGVALGIAKVSNRPQWTVFGALAILALALWTSNSRGIIAAVVVFSVFYLLTRSAKLVSIIAAGALSVGTVASLIIAFSSINPLAIISRDLSGRIRYHSIQIVQNNIGEYWLFGAGIPSGDKGYVASVSSKTFYSSDIGLVGVAFSHGLIGLAGYLLIAFSGCFVGVPLRRLGAGKASCDGASLCGAILAVYSLQSPVYLGSSGAVLGSLFVALMLAAYTRPVQIFSR